MEGTSIVLASYKKFYGSGFCNLEGKLTIVVLERPDDDIHAYLYILRVYLFCHPGEKFQATSKIHNTHCVRRVPFEAKRGIIGGGICFQFAFLRHFAPAHIL